MDFQQALKDPGKLFAAPEAVESSAEFEGHA